MVPTINGRNQNKTLLATLASDSMILKTIKKSLKSSIKSVTVPIIRNKKEYNMNV